MILDALYCRNRGRPPVWLMRQAGRYMPAYQRLRREYPLWTLFHEPELAAQVTLLPIDLLHVDAAIVFSDILVVAEALGLTIVFPEEGGPRVEPQVVSRADVEKLSPRPVEEVLGYVLKTITLVKPQLSVPLIGFCGGPFTLANYFLGTQIAQWVKQKEDLHALLEKITCVSIAYLQAQVRAGVDVIQIFDSWANILTEQERRLFCYPYLKRMIESVDPIPVILFCRHSSLFPEQLAELQPRCVSMDWLRPIDTLRAQVPTRIAIQGNLDPSVLKQSCAEIRDAVTRQLESLKGEPGWIVNLGHGVLPDTPFDNVRCFVETVQSFPFG